MSSAAGAAWALPGSGAIWQGLVGPGGAWRGLEGPGGACSGLEGPGGAWRGLVGPGGTLWIWWDLVGRYLAEAGQSEPLVLPVCDVPWLSIAPRPQRLPHRLM